MLFFSFKLSSHCSFGGCDAWELQRDETRVTIGHNDIERERERKKKERECALYKLKRELDYGNKKSVS